MDPMHDAMKRKMNSLKGPAPEAQDDGHPPEFSTGEGIDLSKIDPALLKAIVDELKENGMPEMGDASAGHPGAPTGLDAGGVKPGSDAAPMREAAVSAIADGGVGHEAGGLHARAAAGAKSHLANFKNKGK